MESFGQAGWAHGKVAKVGPCHLREVCDVAATEGRGRLLDYSGEAGQAHHVLITCSLVLIEQQPQRGSRNPARVVPNSLG